MTSNNARWIRMVVSALLSGMTGAGALLLSAMSNDGQLKTSSVVIAAITGAMLCCKDVQSYLSQPPESMGGVPLPVPERAHSG